MAQWSAKKRCDEARAAYERAKQHGYALGAFNIDNQETLIAACRALKAKNAPGMIEASAGEVEAMGLKNIRDMVDNYREQYGIEVYINLDHSPSVEQAKAGIDAGFEFIHIDISQANKEATEEEIIAQTREVVEYAKKVSGALVESEPHYFGGGSNVFDSAIDYEEVRKTFSTPESAKAFIEATGIDTLAVAIGNLHGRYPVPKKLEIELLKQIRVAIPEQAFLSLHGGSGTPAHYYQAAVTNGISKVNINSDIRFAFRTMLEKQLAAHPDEYAVVKLMDEVISAVQAVVEEKIELFGSANQAVV